MFKNHATGVLFLLSAAVLASALFVRNDTPLWLLLGVYLLWDVSFVASPSSWTGRSPEYANNGVTLARTYMSWYLAFFGVLLGFFFAQPAEVRMAFVGLTDTAQVSLYVLVLPFVLSSIAMLFIPIQLWSEDPPAAANAATSSITVSLKWLFLVNVFCQKASLVVFAYASLRILATVVRQVG